MNISLSEGSNIIETSLNISCDLTRPQKEMCLSFILEEFENGTGICDMWQLGLMIPRHKVASQHCVFEMPFLIV